MTTERRPVDLALHFKSLRLFPSRLIPEVSWFHCFPGLFIFVVSVFFAFLAMYTNHIWNYIQLLHNDYESSSPLQLFISTFSHVTTHLFVVCMLNTFHSRPFSQEMDIFLPMQSQLLRLLILSFYVLLPNAQQCPLLIQVRLFPGSEHHCRAFLRACRPD